MFTLKSLIVVLIFFYFYLFIYFFFVSDLLSLAKRLFAAAYCTKRQQSKKYKQKIEHWNLSFISIPKIFVFFFFFIRILNWVAGQGDISYFTWLKHYFSFLQMSMNAPLCLPPVTWTRSAPILLAHTAVLAALGTLVTVKHAEVRDLWRIGHIRILSIGVGLACSAV